MTAGVDRDTGRVLEGWAHVEQSIRVILTTPIGSRVLRREFGFAGLGLLGRNLEPRTVLVLFALIVAALHRWEPRFRPRRFGLADSNTVDAARAGRISIVMEGDYMPGALAGDLSIVIPRTMRL